ncbi:hypothetical protein C1I98_27070 [Spongiactinospora gelatinilytica]|uniref:Lipoprotein n=1 Tax=Spongiactinospora gelatinilytica TaxID=2666298 RepID=A0A2W2HAK0_9ACTN|nr:hypothetical protein [Spongiactinospora gelatinilytica]PZG36204.1 hypothetical protein C1I98_27070 [Spongiactinospora gelatinilytica]
MRVPLIVCAAALMAACGCAAPAGAGPAQAATARFLDEVRDGQGAAACALLAPEAAESLAEEEGGCASAVLRLGLPGEGTVRQVSVWGDEAQVRLTTDTVFLHRFAEGWLVRGAGCRPDPPGPYDCEVEA